MRILICVLVVVCVFAVVSEIIEGWMVQPWDKEVDRERFPGSEDET